MWAAAQGHAPMVAMLLEAGANPNTRSTVVDWERQRTQEPRDKWLPPGGFTALLLAAREGCVACVDRARRRQGERSTTWTPTGRARWSWR